MNKYLRTTRHLRGGNALIEMALVLPILLSLGFGTVEFGYFFFAKNVIQSAARDGARAAALATATASSPSQAITRTLSSGSLDGVAKTTKVEGTYDGNSWFNVSDVSALAPGTGVRVTVTINFGAMGVRPLGIIPAARQVVGSTTMIKE